MAERESERVEATERVVEACLEKECAATEAEPEGENTSLQQQKKDLVALEAAEEEEARRGGRR